MRKTLALCCGLSLACTISLAGWSDYAPGIYAYASKRFGSEAPKRLENLRQSQLRLLQQVNTVSAHKKNTDAVQELKLLQQVNNFYNHVPYLSDQQHWGQADYWATPIEFYASWGGDCEDYAIAKYMSLKELGVPIERLRITYVRAVKIGETHMVLAYYPQADADPWILDNLVDEVQAGSSRTDLIPVYSFNDEDLWLASGNKRKDGASSVRLWRELITKMEQEQRGQFHY